jgi:type II secretory pathway component PulK
VNTHVCDIAGGRRRRASRQGYVLVMTLVLIVVAALAEAGLARRSLLRALEAQSAQAELARRWAAQSARRTMLDGAAERFQAMEEAATEQRPRWPAQRTAVGEFQVGEWTFRVRLADEDAKLNLNVAYAREPAKLLATFLDLGATELPVVLHPDVSRGAKLKRQAFSSWAQLVVAAAFQLPDGWDRLLAVTDRTTCWGGGKLSLKRADDETLAAVVAGAIGRDNVADVLAARREAIDDLQAAEFVDSLDLRRTDQVKLRTALADESTCFSLAVEMKDAQRRRWSHLWVIGDRQAQGPDETLSFHW